MAINLNPVGITNPDTIIQQNINNITGSIESSVTRNIRNPVLAGAAQSLLGAILGNNQNTSANFQAPSSQTNQNISNIARLFSELDNRSEFSKSCKFLVNIPNPPCIKNYAGVGLTSPSLQFACHTAELPGVNLHPIEFRHNAFTQRVAHFPTFDPITLTFYCFGDMIEKNYFEYWLSYMLDFQSGLLNYPRDKNNQPVSMTDISITAYTNSGQPNYIIKLFDAFPISINAMGLNWQEDRIHELQVTFAYTKWRTGFTDANPNLPVGSGINIPEGKSSNPNAGLNGSVSPSVSIPAINPSTLNFSPPPTIK